MELRLNIKKYIFQFFIIVNTEEGQKNIAIVKIELIKLLYIYIDK